MTPEELGWLENLVSAPDVLAALEGMANASAHVLFLADPASYPVMERALDRRGLSTRALVAEGDLTARLAQARGLVHLVVLDATDEEAARARLLDEFRKRGAWEAVLRPVKVSCFISDYLAAIVAGKSVETFSWRSPRSKPAPRIYAVINTPRSGSSFLCSILAAAGVGAPDEHVRPWLIGLLEQRPAGLFDGVRFARNVIALASVNGHFATKLISHFVSDILPFLTDAERAYLGCAAADAEIFYLARTSKLDQAISERRAEVSGVWHANQVTEVERLPPSALGEDLVRLKQRTHYFVSLERELADLLAGFSHLNLVDYDELSDTTLKVANTLLSRFSLAPVDAVPTTYVKLADESCASLKAAFLKAYPGCESLTALSGAEAIRAARAKHGPVPEGRARAVRGGAFMKGRP